MQTHSYTSSCDLSTLINGHIGLTFTDPAGIYILHRDEITGIDGGLSQHMQGYMLCFTETVIILPSLVCRRFYCCGSLKSHVIICFNGH